MCSNPALREPRYSLIHFGQSVCGVWVYVWLIQAPTLCTSAVEIHPYLPQRELVDWCQRHAIQVRTFECVLIYIVMLTFIHSLNTGHCVQLVGPRNKKKSSVRWSSGKLASLTMSFPPPPIKLQTSVPSWMAMNTTHTHTPYYNLLMALTRELLLHLTRWGTWLNVMASQRPKYCCVGPHKEASQWYQKAKRQVCCFAVLLFVCFCSFIQLQFFLCVWLLILEMMLVVELVVGLNVSLNAHCCYYIYQRGWRATWICFRLGFQRKTCKPWAHWTARDDSCLCGTNNKLLMLMLLEVLWIYVCKWKR